MTESEIPKLASMRAFYHGHPHYGFRGGVPAEIIGVRMVETKYGQRPCFMVLFPDGFIDYNPIEDIKAYTIEAR